MKDTLPHADLSSLYLPTPSDKSITAGIIHALTDAVSEDDGFVNAHYSALRSLSFAIDAKLQDMETCDD